MNDFSTIIKDVRRFTKHYKDSDWNPQVKIAVLGTPSLQYFVQMLRYQLNEQGIQADIYEGEYNGINMAIFDESSDLYSFNPDVVILYTHYLDITNYPALLSDQDDIDKHLESIVGYYKKIWDKIGSGVGKNTQILQTNFVYPPEHLLGNLETKVKSSHISFIRDLNRILVDSAFPTVTIIDAELLSEFVGKYNWFDYPSYFLSKTGFNLDYLYDFSMLFTRTIMASRGKTNKCLVLDLDNTLWGGVVGDEGYDGIMLDPNNAVGESYRYFQKYLLELKNRGIILAVCSKNDEEVVKEPFQKNPNMVLSLDDISCFVANWEDKASNIRRIAQELNIGIDSLVFFDDNPAEREIVKKYIPEVTVIEVPKDPALYAVALDAAFPFEWLQITKEDLSRSSSYVQNRMRVELEKSFVNYDEYLESLEMTASVYEIGKSDAARFTQLLNKSNQFNLRTQRYKESEIDDAIEDSNTKCIAVNLRDRFSEYGIISCIVLKKRDKKSFIESWVMSCRVLKRGVEDLTFEKIIEVSKLWGCDTITGEYLPTKKNSMVSELLNNYGFDCCEDADGCKEYSRSVNTQFTKKTHIRIV